VKRSQALRIILKVIAALLVVLFGVLQLYGGVLAGNQKGRRPGSPGGTVGQAPIDNDNPGGAQPSSAGKPKRTMQGMHTLSGTVTTVDHQTGMISLNTDAGELKLHFPPQAVQSVKEGDTLELSLAFSDGSIARGGGAR
jgi:hypothetical protein